jgi:receptor protein-tyrosine kinase
MSLVERAAKRLEELGRAGSQVSGDLAYPPSHREAAPSLIERAVRKLEAPTASRVEPEQAPSAAQRAERLDIGGDAGVHQAAFAHREPKLGDALTPVTSTVSAPPRSRGASHKVQQVELDLVKLASAGYLRPEDPESVIANEFRRIKRPLIQACQGKLAAPVQNANRIMVTSSVPGEGKSFVSFNLALSIAMERDSTVLLIDADTTRRRLSQLMGIDSGCGLLDLLAGGEVEVADALLRTNIERLTLLPAGARCRHATELLASEAMEDLVQHLASRYSDRILIFDTPPLLGAPEPAVLASNMGQIIVVVEADKTSHKVLTSALATIQSCPVVSTVLNKASSAERGYYYAA